MKKNSPVEHIAVWRAARQIIARHPYEPGLAACQLADEALDAGKVYEFQLWQTIAKAVQKIKRKQ
jgi:hypothetical protein